LWICNGIGKFRTKCRLKLESKKCDLIVANNIHTQGAGFKVDTNVATLFTKNNTKQLNLMSKEDLAMIILQTLKEIEDAFNN